jgi:hypothetical protein
MLRGARRRPKGAEGLVHVCVLSCLGYRTHNCEKPLGLPAGMDGRSCSVCGDDNYEEEFAHHVEIGTCGDCGSKDVCIICWQQRDCCTKVHLVTGVHL